MTKTSTFDPDEHDKYDKPIKDLTIAQLPKILDKYDQTGQYEGLTLTENPDEFGIDLLGMTNHGPLNVEVEYTKTKMWNGPLPFNHLHIWERKRKFIGAIPTLFVLINHDLTYMATVPGATVNQYPWVWFFTQNRGPEKVIPVPREFVKVYPIEGWIHHDPATTRQ